MDYRYIKDVNGQMIIETWLSGHALMLYPLLNKGMSFTEQERQDFNLYGLLPPHVGNLFEQRSRSYLSFKSKQTDLEKYIYLRDVQDSNETLFYSLLCEYITEMLPIVYTPTVGLGCQLLSHIYRRPRGIYIAYPYIERIEQILANPHFDAVEVIVVSDGERILGLGDQGAGGMGISIGKLSLYSACAGIHPEATLPIFLDTGTSNFALLNDPLYIGWNHERIRGQAYDDFIEHFVQGVKKRFPHVLLQWEDFGQQNANFILNRYKNELCTFNDDIQGTAAVATAALLAAIRASGNHLLSQKIVIVGAGSAGCGIASLVVKVMIEEGISESEALAKIFMVDRYGLLIEGMKDIQSFQKPFLKPTNLIAAWKHENIDKISLEEVINNVQPTVLLGVSGQAGIFSEQVIRSMAKHVQKPIIFPLSNPTSQSEAVPSDLMLWTEARAIISTGSPFPPIIKNGQSYRVDQTNNSYIFPGMGLGLITAKAKLVTDEMFMAAAKALASCSPVNQSPQANLLPPFTQIRRVSFAVALAVAKEAIKAGLAPYCSDEELASRIQSKMWVPAYVPYRRVRSSG